MSDLPCPHHTPTHPGGHDLSERQIGWRAALAVAWRAIEHAQDAQACRERIAALGNGRPPEGIGEPRSMRTVP